MDHTALNLFDIIVGLVIVLSALLSFFRGFVREMLSLSSWLGATILTLYMFPHVTRLLKPYITNPTLASGFGAILTFLLALILISMLTSLLLKFLKTGADVGLLDHGMGLIFGLARGVLIVAIGYFIFSLAVSKDQTPEWMKGSVTRPYVAQASRVMAKMAPGYLDELTGNAKKKLKNVESTLKEQAEEAKSADTKKDVEDDIDHALDANKPVKNSTPSEEPTDWPNANDLKQRLQETK